MRPIDRILDITRFTPAAHRGAPQEFPENTLESFAAARVMLPGCLLETDVRRTSDGIAVLRHDNLLETTTNGRGPVSSLSFGTVRSLDAGYAITFDGGKTYPFRGRGYRIATLEAALTMFPDSLFSVDVKDRDRGFAARVIEIIRDREAQGRVIVGSFHGNVMRYLRRVHPDIVRSAPPLEVVRLLLCRGAGLMRLCRPRDRALFVPQYHFGRSPEYTGRHPGIQIVSEGFIDAAHERGVPVFAWTINRTENMRHLIRCGINGIVTDYPDLLCRVMREEGMPAE
ncbi:MAG: glycerophosphodiester phosphodiesterase [Spirochaetes bacterium]|nr:glycerophosphodiester phosphodiesterase [Spirochaetota bacterium]